MAHGDSQSGIRQRSSETIQKSNLFTGIWNLNQNNLDAYDPFISGYAFIIWTKMPAFMVRADKEMADKFRALTERNFKSFSGIGNINLQVDDLTAGFAGNAYGVVTNIQKENTSFSLTHYEITGSPVRQVYSYWVSGIRDMETGLATYHGLIASGAMEYSQKNHTGELLYVVTDPSGGVHENGGGIEFACYYTNVVPTSIPQDHLAYTAGDHGIHEITMEFRGNFHMGANVNELAKKAMKSYRITQQFGDYQVKADDKLIGFVDTEF
jgi:hypothetical protein